jgi:hypothetical protein
MRLKDWNEEERKFYILNEREDRVKLVGGGSHEKVRVKVTCECELL